MNLISKSHERYSHFCTHLRRNWTNVLFYEEAGEILEEYCQSKDQEKYLIDEPSPVSSTENARIKLKPKNLLGLVKSSTGGGSEWGFKWVLVSSIALFEAFASDIAELVYLDNPEKFLLSEKPESSTISLELLLDSESKQEVIEKYIEQKLIGVFYGNPSDAFVRYKNNNQPKDGKLNLDTGSYLHHQCENELKFYVEMTKRRNVIVHNEGIINRRYLKEVPHDSIHKLQLNDKVEKNMDKQYLFEGTKALHKLARFYIIQTMVTACNPENKVENESLKCKFKKKFR
ncbi:MAG: hypothetical protein KAG26_03565 [Methylococcales bacterium]|nr:hypothetical protein [Methylococcales bacterium]